MNVLVPLTMVRHYRVSADVGLAGHGADAQTTTGVLDAGQPVNGVEVDQVIEAGQPHGQHRNEALPPGERLGLVAVLGQEVQGLGQALRRVVPEGGGLHLCALVSKRSVSNRSAMIAGARLPPLDGCGCLTFIILV